MNRNFPEMHTKRLILRELEPEDIEALYANWSNPLVMKKTNSGCLSKVSSVRVLEILRNLWRLGEGVQWGIIFEGRLVGICGFHSYVPYHRRAELGYNMNCDFWRRGIMTEAVIEILRFGFHNMDLMRVQAFTNVDNERSIGFLKSNGFVEEGVLRGYDNSYMGFIDQRCFSMLRSEWEEQNIAAVEEAASEYIEKLRTQNRKKSS